MHPRTQYRPQTFEAQNKVLHAFLTTARHQQGPSFDGLTWRQTAKGTEIATLGLTGGTSGAGGMYLTKPSHPGRHRDSSGGTGGCLGASARHTAHPRNAQRDGRQTQKGLRGGSWSEREPGLRSREELRYFALQSFPHFRNGSRTGWLTSLRLPARDSDCSRWRAANSEHARRLAASTMTRRRPARLHGLAAVSQNYSQITSISEDNSSGAEE